jgi:hypothetical protein
MMAEQEPVAIKTRRSELQTHRSLNKNLMDLTRRKCQSF